MKQLARPLRIRFFRTALALIIFALTAASSAGSQDATGWFEQYCDGASLHLEKFAGKAEAPGLVFWFWTRIQFDRIQGADWYDVQLCPTEKHCEETAKAKMQFLEQRKHLVTGRYVVDFNGQHNEGQFTLSERHHKHPVHLCM
jgi:hypothetical protein